MPESVELIESNPRRALAALRKVAEAASDVSKGSSIQADSPDWLVVSVRKADWHRFRDALKELAGEPTGV